MENLNDTILVKKVLGKDLKEGDSLWFDITHGFTILTKQHIDSITEFTKDYYFLVKIN